jgi:hypothetical protein
MVTAGVGVSYQNLLPVVCVHNTAHVGVFTNMKIIEIYPVVCVLTNHTCVHAESPASGTLRFYSVVCVRTNYT